MFGIGVPELILILIVGLIVFGPSKLPEVGRAVGKGLREFKKASTAIQATLNEPDPPPAQPAPAPAQPAASPQPAAPAAQPAAAPQSAGAASAEAPSNQAIPESVAAAAAAAKPVYTPPTQDSVRQQLSAQGVEAKPAEPAPAPQPAPAAATPAAEPPKQA